ncbi:MAG: S8 family serine peptidase [Chloroflexi bacterium]|nr:S8 family serine peptidase [Chloroflexota bacterium]
MTRPFRRLSLAVVLLVAVAIPLLAPSGQLSDPPLMRVELTSPTGDVDGVAQLVTSVGGAVELVSGGRVQALVSAEAHAALEAAHEQARVETPGVFVELQTQSAADFIGATEWHRSGFTGHGTRVAIVDAGFSGYQQRLGASLPREVTVRSFRSDGQIAGSSEHGRRAAELVHAVAPGAHLYFVNFSTVTELSAAVDYLAAEGIDVVSFSLGYIHNGPGDGTGPVNAIVSRGVGAGQLWVVASGNWAQQHWGGPFRDTDGDTVHEFAQGSRANDHHFQAGDLITVSLRWDDQWGAACSDYDLELFGPSGALVRASRNVQNCTQDPVEAFQVLATQTGTYSVRIIEAHAEAPRELNLMVVGTPDRGQPLTFHTLTSSLSEPADHPDVVTVGALTAGPTRVEAPYSSRGPTVDWRFKPNILAPTGGNGEPGGTSAAAPHVAASAALLAEAFPAADAQRLTTLLQTRALGVVSTPGGSGARSVHVGSLFGVGPLLPAGASSAALLGAIPGGPGVAFVVYDGPDGYPARFIHLIADMRTVRSVWRIHPTTGEWESFVPGAPTWVNRFDRFNNRDPIVVVFGAR